MNDREKNAFRGHQRHKSVNRRQRDERFQWTLKKPRVETRRQRAKRIQITSKTQEFEPDYREKYAFR